MASILMIVAPERFRDEELFVTVSELEGAGHEITIASRERGACVGSRGGATSAILALSDVDTTQFDAVVFVGGGGCKVYFTDSDAIRVAREMNASGKLVAAICLAPVILANAGVLLGKNATVAGTEARTIEAKGAKYSGPGVMCDGNVVTANGPKSSQLFGRRINELLLSRCSADLAPPTTSLQRTGKQRRPLNSCR